MKAISQENENEKGAKNFIGADVIQQFVRDETLIIRRYRII